MRIKPESQEDLTELLEMDVTLPDDLFWRFKWKSWGQFEAQIRRPSGYFLAPSRCIVNGTAWIRESDDDVKKTVAAACSEALEALEAHDAREAAGHENFWKDFNGDFKKRGCG